MDRGELKREANKLHARVCSIMSNPKRLEIIDLLSEGEKSVEELTQAMNILKANVSQHLALLRHYNIVVTRKEVGAMEWVPFLKFVHVLSFAFMSVPLFNLIAVNERARLGATMLYGVDRYLENVIGGLLLRCYSFQLTVLASGLALVFLQKLDLIGSWVLLAKFVLLLVIIGLHNYAYFSLQRPINRLLAQVNADPVPEEIAAQIRPLRARRKKLASVCLFLVLVIILLGLQVYVRFNPILTAVLIMAMALFAWRAYKSRVPYGWA